MSVALSEGDILSGRFEPVATRFRVERRTHLFEFIDDVSHAITSASITLDTTAAICRSARVSILPDLLPSDFDLYEDHLAIIAEVRIGDEWREYAMGLFHIDTVDDTWRMDEVGRRTWSAECADVLAHLFEYEVTQPYTIAAGVHYTEAIEEIIVSLGLLPAIPPSGLVTIVPLTWPAGTSYGQIVNDLLAGINYFPAWADRQGRITSRERIAPHLEQPAVVYTTESEPRMIRDGFSQRFLRAQATNTIQVTVSSAALAPSSIEAVNDDPLSSISTVNRGPSVSQVAGDRMPSSDVMMATADYLVRDAAVRARTASLNTIPDPRRDAHEFYTVEVPGLAPRLYRCEGWTFDCRPGATMAHRLADASEVQVTVEQTIDRGAPIVPLTPIVINHPVTYRGMTRTSTWSGGSYITFDEPPGTDTGDCIVVFASGTRSGASIPAEWKVLLDDTTNDVGFLTLARGSDPPNYGKLVNVWNRGEILIFACAAGTYLALPSEIDITTTTVAASYIAIPTLASATNGDRLFSLVDVNGNPGSVFSPKSWMREKADQHVASYACANDGGCASPVSGTWRWSWDAGSPFTATVWGWVVPALPPTTIERERI